MHYYQTQEFLFKLGDKKRAVVFLKQLLQEMPELVIWVPDLKKVVVNETYDEITFNAVRRFQIFHNLIRKDGIVDQVTWYFIGQRIHPARLKMIESAYPSLYKFIIGKTKNNSILAPKGYASDRILSDEECDIRFAEIFGEKNAVARAMVTKDMKSELGRGMSGHSAESRNDFPTRIIFEGKLSKNPDRGGIIHIYTDEKASGRKDVGLFAPRGWKGTPVSYFVEGNSGLRFNYSTGLTINTGGKLKRYEQIQIYTNRFDSGTRRHKPFKL